MTFIHNTEFITDFILNRIINHLTISLTISLTIINSNHKWNISIIWLWVKALYHWLWMSWSLVGPRGAITFPPWSLRITWVRLRQIVDRGFNVLWMSPSSESSSSKLVLPTWRRRQQLDVPHCWSTTHVSLAWFYEASAHAYPLLSITINSPSMHIHYSPFTHDINSPSILTIY